jgi:hypothetical protein
MASLAVMTAVEARLPLWPHLDACPLVDANEVSTVPKPPFLEIQYPVAIEDRMSRGRPAIYRERGGIRFIITVAAFDAEWRARVFGWIEELRDLYRSQSFDLVETDEASPAVLDDRNRDGNRFRLPFVVTYTYDSIK